jgi:hypothetical protein
MWNLQFTSWTYNEATRPRYEFPSEEFDRAIAAAGHSAFLETLSAGHPVFYRDGDGLYVKELPDGRRFEIRWIPGASPRVPTASRRSFAVMADFWRNADSKAVARSREVIRLTDTKGHVPVPVIGTRMCADV